MGYVVVSVFMGDFYSWSHWKMNDFCGAFFDKVDKSSLVFGISFWKHLQKFWEPVDFGGLLIPPPQLSDGSLCWESCSGRKATVSEEVACTTSRTDTFTYWFQKSLPDCTENPGHNSIQTGNSLVFKPYLWFRWVFVTPTYILPALLQNLFWQWRQWRKEINLNSLCLYLLHSLLIFLLVYTHHLGKLGTSEGLRNPCLYLLSSKLKAALSCKSRGLQVLLCLLHLMFCKMSGSRWKQQSHWDLSNEFPSM